MQIDKQTDPIAAIARLHIAYACFDSDPNWGSEAEPCGNILERYKKLKKIDPPRPRKRRTGRRSVQPHKLKLNHPWICDLSKCWEA